MDEHFVCCVDSQAALQDRVVQHRERARLRPVDGIQSRVDPAQRRAQSRDCPIAGKPQNPHGDRYREGQDCERGLEETCHLKRLRQRDELWDAGN